MHHHLRYLLAVGLVAGCSALPQGTQETAVKASISGCNGYGSALASLAAFRAAGQLSEGQVALVDSLRPGLNAICEGTYPMDPAAAQAQLSGGISVLNAIISQVKK